MSPRKRNTPLAPVTISTEHCTPEVKQQIIEALPLLVDLSSEERRSVSPVFREIGFAAGERIAIEPVTLGEAGSSSQPVLFLVGAGLVKLLRTDYDGRDVVLEFLVTGDLFGGAVGADEDDLAVAHTAVCAFAVTGRDLQALFARRPAVASRMIEFTAARVRRLHERLHLLTGAPARSRILATLRSLAEKLGKPTPEGLLLEIPLSRDDLASLSGTTAETASRVVSALQREGHLTSGRRWITLKDGFPRSPGLD